MSMRECDAVYFMLCAQLRAMLDATPCCRVADAMPDFVTPLILFFLIMILFHCRLLSSIFC